MKKVVVLSMLLALAASIACAQVTGKFKNASPYDYGNGAVSSSSRYIFGGPTLDGSIEMVSHCSDSTQCIAPNYNFAPATWTWSGIAFVQASNRLATLGQITKLSTDFSTGAPDCSGGSPRLVIFTANHSFTANFGAAPYGGNCFYGWQNTGNLANAGDPTLRWQVDVGNTFYSWSQLLSVASQAGDRLKEVDIILDSGWIGLRGQEVMIDNFTVNTNRMNSLDILHQ